MIDTRAGDNDDEDTYKGTYELTIRYAEKKDAEEKQLEAKGNVECTAECEDGSYKGNPRRRLMMSRKGPTTMRTITLEEHFATPDFLKGPGREVTEIHASPTPSPSWSTSAKGASR